MIDVTEGLVFSRVKSFIFVLAFLFPIINGVDFFIIKGASLHEIVKLREMENLRGGRGSIIGALVTFLSATPPIAMALVLLSPPAKKRHKLVVWVALVLGFGCMFLTGGRNAFFLSILFVFIFASTNYKAVISNLPLHTRIGVGGLVVCGIVYSLYLFVARFTISGFSDEYMITYLSFFYGVEVEPMSSDNEFSAQAYSIWVWFVYYLCHPLGFIQEYFSIGYEPNTLGAYSFSVYARVIDVLFGTSYFIDAQNSLLTKGVYLTLPGSLYVDYGYRGSLVIIGFIGILLGSLSARKPALNIVGKLWMSYIILLFVFSPFYNAFSIGNGISFLTLLLIITLFKIRWISKA